MTTIKELGWRQGSIFFRNDTWAFQSWFPAVSHDSYLMVITHTCAVVSDSLQKEPTAEFLVLKRTESLEKEHANGRNPRLLSFYVTENNIDIPVLAHISKRYSFARHWLLNSTPHENITISDETLRKLTTWLARRYTRPAFPDEFNRRTDAPFNKIQKKFKKAAYKEAVNNLISFALEIPEYKKELSEGEDYELGVYLIVDGEQLELHRDKYEELIIYVTGELENCEGIGFFGAEIIGDDDLTVAQSRQLKLYDLDSLSFNEEGQLITEQDT